MFRAFFTFTFSALSRAQEVAVYRYTDIYMTSGQQEQKHGVGVVW